MTKQGIGNRLRGLALSPKIYSLKPAFSGFTLVELLVVIAIIAILSGIVLASLSGARAQGRDAQRISDVKQLQLALSTYYDQHNAYPLTLQPLQDENDIPAMPHDPTTGNLYWYVPYGLSASQSTCSSYHVGASLETNNATALHSDSDISAPPTNYGICSGGPGSDFNGSDSGPCGGADKGIACFDMKS